MTTQTVVWSPDTCAPNEPSCIIELSYDDTTSLDTRTYTPTNIYRQCSIHQGLGNITQIHSVVSEENQRKNNALQNIIDNAPTQLQDQLFTVQNNGRILKKGVEYVFDITGTPPNRVVNVTFTGVTLTPQQKTAAQNFLNNRFGTGKVVIT